MRNYDVTYQKHDKEDGKKLDTRASTVCGLHMLDAAYNASMGGKRGERVVSLTERSE